MRGFILAVGLLVGCGGAVERDEMNEAPITSEPVQCVEHLDCPDVSGYRTCRAGYCTFRCDTDADLELCVTSGGSCRDLGDSNVFCEW